MDTRGLQVRGLPTTVARMALTVGVSGSQLAAAGHAEAAEAWEVLSKARDKDLGVLLRALLRECGGDVAEFVPRVMSLAGAGSDDRTE